MKKVINEQQLVNIVAEATKRVLKEIGDTAAGRAMLSRAAGKAQSLGRFGQSEKFKIAADSAQNDVYGGGAKTVEASTKCFKYTCVYDKLVKIYNTGKLIVREDDGTVETQGFLKDIVKDPNAQHVVKTSDKVTARKIAAWIQENCATDGLPQEVLDWHFWARQ